MGFFKKNIFAPFTDVGRKSSSTGSNIRVLDGIRGVAVLIVLASHTSAFGMHGQGSLGVYLFFFLSGFVLMIPFAESQSRIRNGTVLVKYIRNRALRIIPLYVVMVLIMAVMMNSGWQWYLWNVSFIKGWNHLWSVAEEVRFYVLFPGVVFLLSFLKNQYVKLLVFASLIVVVFKLKGSYKIDMMDGRFVSFHFYMFLSGMFTCLLVELNLLGAYFSSRLGKLLLRGVPVFILFAFFFKYRTDTVSGLSVFIYPFCNNIPCTLKGIFYGLNHFIYI